MLAIETYHTYFDSPIGIIKIGGTETYINEIMFIDDKQQLQYSSTPGISDVLHECTEQLIEYFNGKRKVFNIAIHQEGTVFQQKVWGKLMDIKYGKTASYLEVSKQVGDEKAVRAVAALVPIKHWLAIRVVCGVKNGCFNMNLELPMGFKLCFKIGVVNNKKGLIRLFVLTLFYY
jgi:methylated-DNA-[protein]-cysteine S-methyltransferase